MRNLLDRMIRRMVPRGTLKITYADGTLSHYGDGTGQPVHLRFNTSGAERRILFNPEFYLGECYADGSIDIIEGDMFALLETILSPHEKGLPDQYLMAALRAFRFIMRHVTENNVLHRSRANVQHHYDLTGKLYDLFLDADRQYSCAYFDPADCSLDEAQLAKKRHIAAKLVFDRPGLDVLDIGCGWGGMGLYLARHLGATVRGITLSDEQLAIARARAEAAGLSERLAFELEDYRHTVGHFDRIVSVGMFEHVGRPHYRTYFDQCARLLKRDGVMLLHTIGRTDRPTVTNPFIERYIFPGGYIPSLSEVMTAIEPSGLRITDIEILRLHYAETLKHWRTRFMARREDARALYDERFCRIWEFYLATSESAFRWQGLVIFQIQLAHDQAAVPLTRDYIARAETALKKRETGDGSGPVPFPAQAAE